MSNIIWVVEENEKRASSDEGKPGDLLRGVFEDETQRSTDRTASEMFSWGSWLWSLIWEKKVGDSSEGGQLNFVQP